MAEEKPSFEDDMTDNVYRFAHDLMTYVIKKSGTKVPYLKVPNPETFLFTEAHRRIIDEFLAKEGGNIDYLVTRFATRHGELDYSDINYLVNRDEVVAKYTPQPYSEEGFLQLCAAIANLAACIFSRNPDCNVTIHAMKDVHSLVRVVLSHGTLQHSSLPKDVLGLLTSKARIYSHANQFLLGN